MSDAKNVSLYAFEKITLAERFTARAHKRIGKLALKGDDCYLPGTPERIAIYRKRYESLMETHGRRRIKDSCTQLISGMEKDTKIFPKKSPEKTDRLYMKRLRLVQNAIFRTLSDSSAG